MSGSLVIRFDLGLLVGNQLVVALRWQVECGGDDADPDNEEDGPRCGDEMEAGVEVPGGGKAGRVVEEVGLKTLVIFTPQYIWYQLQCSGLARERIDVPQWPYLHTAPQH